MQHAALSQRRRARHDGTWSLLLCLNLIKHFKAIKKTINIMYIYSITESMHNSFCLCPSER